MRNSLVILLLGVFVIACQIHPNRVPDSYTTSKKEKIFFRSASPDWDVDLLDGLENDEQINVFGYFQIPTGSFEIPIPLMIFAHSSGGEEVHKKWYDLFHSMGVATFELRYFESRGVKMNTYVDGEWVTDTQATTDAFKEFELLEKYPRINGSKLV